MSNAHCMTCCVTKPWLSGSLWDRTIRIRHSFSKWAAADVREEREADTPASGGSSGNRTTVEEKNGGLQTIEQLRVFINFLPMSVTALTILSEHGMKASKCSSLAEISSSWMHLVMASVRRTTSSWLGRMEAADPDPVALEEAVGLRSLGSR